VLQVATAGLSGAPPPMAVAMLLIEAELHLAVGQPVVAWRLLHNSIARERSCVWTAIVESKLLLAEGRSAEVVERWKQVPDTEASPPIAVEAYLVRARAACDVGQASMSWRFAERALQLAEVEGIRRPFLVNAELLQDLLISHLSTGTRYGERLVELIRAMSGPMSGPMNGSAAPADRSRGQPAESLTQRESVVLRYLDSTLSTAEIADVLNVSANTVKTHMKNVYRKLEVGRRRDAVRRGRELGLR
jgi:LuxR family maltose regulon positive regulatory protein